MEQIHPSQGTIRARFQRKRMAENQPDLHILPGTAVWASSNSSVARVVPDPEQVMGALIIPGSEPGFARITFEALLDGDVDETGQLPTIRATRVVELQVEHPETDGFIIFDIIEEPASL